MHLDKHCEDDNMLRWRYTLPVVSGGLGCLGPDETGLQSQALGLASSSMRAKLVTVQLKKQRRNPGFRHCISLALDVNLVT